MRAGYAVQVEQVGFARRPPGTAEDLGARRIQPYRAPAVLEATVAGKEDVLAAPEIRGDQD
jgi:hypothetical protein